MGKREEVKREREGGRRGRSEGGIEREKARKGSEGDMEEGEEGRKDAGRGTNSAKDQSMTLM